MKDFEQKMVKADGFLQRGEYKKALRILKRCLKTDPSEPLILFNLGIVYYRMGLYEKSMYVLEDAIKKAAPIRKYIISLG